MSENAIEITNLVKAYGSNRVLKEISFSVEKGEILGFLGLNGAGKSTTMNIITGCISPSEGSVTVCGYDVLEEPQKVKAKIGYLPENPPLYFDMTVYEYLEFVYEIKGAQQDRKAHLEEIMERVQITHMRNRLIKNLSKGYKQRVGIAQALVGDPEVLILDEPTVGLDPKQIIEIRELIRSLGKNHTVILSTHIMQEVSAVCDRVVIITSGTIVAQNTIKGLQEDDDARRELLLRIKSGGNNPAGHIDCIPSVESVEETDSAEADSVQYRITQCINKDARDEICKVLVENGYSILEIKPAAASLEEIFIKYSSVNIQDTTDAESKDGILNRMVRRFKK